MTEIIKCPIKNREIANKRWHSDDANACERIPKIRTHANDADNDNDNDIDNDIDNDDDKENDNEDSNLSICGKNMLISKKVIEAGKHKGEHPVSCFRCGFETYVKD